jgi:hypothetical protein
VSIAAIAGPLDLPPPQHDPERAREAADRILARPEYRWSDTQNWIDRISEWLNRQLERLVEPFGATSVPVWVGWLVIGLLVALVAFLLYRGRTGWRRARRDSGPSGGPVVVTEAEVDVDWAAEAVAHEAAGRWREGLRCRHRALVRELSGRGVLGDLAGRTSGELAREVADTCPPAAEAFDAATELFELAWYGGSSVGPAERDRFVEQADRTLAAVDAVDAPKMAIT